MGVSNFGNFGGSVMPRKTSILIYDGSDFERLSELRRAVTIAERKVAQEKADLERAQDQPRRMGDDEVSDAEVVAAEAAVEAARVAYDAAVDEAAERAEEWELEAIGHGEWRDLLAKHPPRKVTVEVPAEGDEPATSREVTHPDDDEPWLVDTSTFGKALLHYRHTDEDGDTFRTVTKPDLDEAGLRRRIKRLSDGEFESLWTTAYLLNKGGIADPKASRYGTTPTSSAT